MSKYLKLSAFFVKRDAVLCEALTRSDLAYFNFNREMWCSPRGVEKIYKRVSPSEAIIRFPGHFTT